MAFIQNTGIPSGPNPPNSVVENVPCDASVAVGNWVRLDSGIAVNALADNLVNSHVIGVVEYKFSSIQATIRLFGASNPIFVGLDPDKDYFLSDTVPGAMQITPPTDPGCIVLKLGQPFSSTRFVVNIGIRMQRS